MAYPADLKYTKEHEWIRVAGDVAEVGQYRSLVADQGDSLSEDEFQFLVE